MRFFVCQVKLVAQQTNSQVEQNGETEASQIVCVSAGSVNLLALGDNGGSRSQLSTPGEALETIKEPICRMCRAHS